MTARIGTPPRARPAADAGAGARRLRAAILALALVPLLLKAPAAAEFTGAILTYPFQVDDSEGVILSEAQWLARGVDPYRPARPDFFTAAPYTPLYTLLNAAAFAAGPFTFKVGRGLALLATLAIGVGVGWLVRWRTRGLLLGLWAALAVLTLNLVSVWSVRARPDHLALAFNLAGLALIWRAECVEEAGRGRSSTVIPHAARRTPHLLAAVLFALGFYTKQTLLAAPLAAGLYLLLVRPRRGLAFGALYAALVLVPFAALDLLTSGGFYQHIVAFHRSWSAAGFLELWGPFVARYWPLLAVAAALPLLVLPRAVAGAIAEFRGRAAGHRRGRAGSAPPHSALRTPHSPDLLPALYGVTAALGGLGAGTHGGNHNHFVETLVAAVLCAALVIARLLAGGGARPAWRAALGGLLVLALSSSFLLEARLDPRPPGAHTLARDFRTPRPAERAGWAQIAAFVTNDPGPVYSDNVGLLLVSGQEVRYTDPFSLSYAARTGQWDQTSLVGRVERGEFTLIALRYDIFAVGGAPTDLTPELLQAIRARYRVIERNVLYLYAPR